MASSQAVYRTLLTLYPRDFRDEYADDLLQHLADLTSDRGRGTAWRRTGIDLLVTIPRFRLESIMSEQHSSTTLTLMVTLLAVGGVLSFMAGVYAGLILLAAAVALAVAQRSSLARAIRTPDSNRRRGRLQTAAMLAVICLAALASYIHAIGNDHISTASLLVHNAIGVPSMIGAIVYLILGLFTPKTTAPEVRPTTQ